MCSAPGSLPSVDQCTVQYTMRQIWCGLRLGGGRGVVSAGSLCLYLYEAALGAGVATGSSATTC
jgi:hypothetical protein